MQFKMRTLRSFETWARRRRIFMTTFSSDFLLLTTLALLIDLGSGGRVGSPVDKECKAIGNVIRSKDFTYPWWVQEGSGSVFNRAQQQTTTTMTPQASCPLGKNGERGVKCCRELNSTIQRGEMGAKFGEKWLSPKLAANGDIFKERKKKFDTTFKDLLTRAHSEFHAMFERTYGMLYMQHAPIFHALFTTLEAYYDTGLESLEGKLNEFFAILTRKMFVVLNSQYEFDDAYLSCATIVISEKQGGDLHRQIVSSLRRSFVATRALAQGLNDADRIFNNLQKLKTTPECASSLSHMLQCPICSEMRVIKPCTSLCTGITSQCLAVMGPLIKTWTDYTNSMENVLDRLLGPYNVEAVVEPIHIKISEAIMNFQESGPDLSQSVFAKCGKPKLISAKTFRKREASPPPENLRRRPDETSSKLDTFRATTGHDNVQASKSMDKLLREIKNKVKKSKSIWEALPRQVCNGISKDYSSKLGRELCWNGTHAIRPDRNRTSNESPESRSSSSFGKTAPNILITEQIIILQQITEKLRASYNGLDVQWQESDDLEFEGSGMGSGSGDIPTDLEDSDDDDPSGQIHPKPPFHHSSATPNFPTHPKFPSRPSPPILNPIPNHDDEEDDDDVEIDEDEDSDEIHGSNTNNNVNRNPLSNLSPVDTFNNNKNSKNRGHGGGFSIDGPEGIDLAPPPPSVNKPVYPPFFPTEGTTTSTTTSTTRRPILDVSKKKHPSTSSGSIDEAGKAIAFFKLFSPIFASLVGKAFSFT